LALEPLKMARASGPIVLALNSGSSSLKFGLYRVGAGEPERLLSGKWATTGGGQAEFRAVDGDGGELPIEASPILNQEEAMARVAKLFATHALPRPDAIGHRMVHGGPNLRRHCTIDDTVLRALHTALPFAPLHLPPALALIGFARAHFPDVPQMACFDTAFHANLPDVARVLPIPKALQAEGIQRYGFHGLSCESIVRALGRDLPERVVIAHLGNGASITAVKSGRSIDTSMGLSPTGGVIMSTRTGDLDPGVLIYLMREKGLDAKTLEEWVDHRSGLLGISGISGDMRSLHAASPSNPDARLAIAMFVSSVRKHVAAMIAALEGVDLLVFTGGIGENDDFVRAGICAGLSWAGISLDASKNGHAQNPISEEGSRCAVLVLQTGEDAEIARHTAALLQNSAPGRKA
jgi:acetate kinase